MRVQLEGRNLPTESLLKRYLPKACSHSFRQVATKYRTCLAHNPAGSAENLPIPFGLVSYIIVSLKEDLQLFLQCLPHNIVYNCLSQCKIAEPGQILAHVGIITARTVQACTPVREQHLLAFKMAVKFWRHYSTSEDRE